MKRIGKILITAAVIAGMSLPVLANVYCPDNVRIAIDKYKAQDYVGCIQDLEEYAQKDPTNAIAYYYTAIAYMKVGMKDKAIENFEKVSMINSVPVLSSYAVQASKCMMEETSPCIYKRYTKDEIAEMVKDPFAFFEKKELEAQQKESGETKEEEIVSEEEMDDIDRLIKGQYPDNVHPDANRIIQETKLIQEQERVNAELNQKGGKRKPPKKSDASDLKIEKIALGDNLSDKEIADAVRTLNKAGYKFVAPNEQNNSNNNPNPYKMMSDYYALNQDSAEMAMMFGSNNRRNNDAFNQLLPILLMQEQQNNSSDKSGNNQRKINPELIKTMMMSSMMGDFDLGYDRDKDR